MSPRVLSAVVVTGSPGGKPGNVPSDAGVVSSLRSVSRGVSVIVIAVGCLVLIGWALDIARIKSVWPGFVAMKANTAVAFVLVGAALWLLQPEPPARRARRVASLCAVVAAAMGLVTLAEYLLGRDLGIDQLLFTEPAGAAMTSHLGRMAPATAASFLAIGVALLILDARRGRRLVHGLLLATALASLVAVVGYLYGVMALYEVGPYTPIAVHTAVSFVILCAGVACARPERGLMALVASDGAGGIMVRRLLPVAIGAPVILGWFFEEWLVWLYKTEFGHSLHAVSLVVLLSLVVLWNGWLLLVSDQHRRRAEAETRRLNAELEQRVIERTMQLEASNRDLQDEIAERQRAQDEIRTLSQELEQRVVGRTAQLEAANRELEAFSYSVSHDLRAPLRHLDGFAKLLLKRDAGQLDETSTHYVHMIAESAIEMGRLIDDLLAFSRTGRAELHTERFELGPLVKEVQRQMAPTMEGRQIAWEVGVLPAVEADPALLRIVWVNLLSNAIKFTAPRPEARIDISAMRIADCGLRISEHGAESADGSIRIPQSEIDDLQSDAVVVAVRDNGVGFDMQYAHKLFGVFQRLHSAEEFEGTGIGLATVRRIIHRHGGQVWAESEAGRGTTFYFTLRIAQGGVPGAE